MLWIIAATTAIFCRIVQFLYYSLCITTLILEFRCWSNHYFSLTFLRKKTLKKYVDMFLACQKSKVTIKLKFYYSNLKNAVETAKIAVDSCYVLWQFLTPLPSIDFREIRGLEGVWTFLERPNVNKAEKFEWTVPHEHIYVIQHPWHFKPLINHCWWALFAQAM